MRAMVPFEPRTAAASSSGTPVLIVSGASDPLVPRGRADATA